MRTKEHFSDLTLKIIFPSKRMKVTVTFPKLLILIPETERRKVTI